MENTDKKSALEFFHAQPNNWNCAQCILKTYQLRSQLSDEDIERDYRSKGGGKAPEGLCGALYASRVLLGEDSKEAAELTEDFRKELGAVTCLGLKRDLHVPCTRTVSTADALLNKQLEKK